MMPPKPQVADLKPVTDSVGRTIELTADDLDRIWSHIDVDGDGCWVWTGSRLPSGYGRTTIAGSRLYVHRIVYMILVGPIEAGLHTDHLCRNHPCCNPAHLEPVTCRENVLRSPVAIAAINASKTHCNRGHELSGKNLVLIDGGGRRCRTCAISSARERYAAATGSPVNSSPVDLDEPIAPRRQRGAEACIKGHVLDLFNTYVDPKGYKHCRACRAAAQNRYEARKKGNR